MIKAFIKGVAIYWFSFLVVTYALADTPDFKNYLIEGMHFSMNEDEALTSLKANGYKVKKKRTHSTKGNFYNLDFRNKRVIKTISFQFKNKILVNFKLNVGIRKKDDLINFVADEKKRVSIAFGDSNPECKSSSNKLTCAFKWWSSVGELTRLKIKATQKTISYNFSRKQQTRPPPAKPTEVERIFIDGLRAGDCSTIQSLLEKHQIDPDKKLESMSLLKLAASKGDICIMRALLKSGASINGADGKSEPITSAYMGKQYDAVKFLTDLGATVPDLLNTFALIENSKGNTAAAEALSLDIEKLKKPQKKKPEQDVINIEGPSYFASPGYYTGPCVANVNDANPKNTRPGDTGDSVLIYSVFKDVARGPVHVKEVMAPQCKAVYLDSPHGYIMTTRIFIEKWQWLCAGTRDIRKDCPYVTKKTTESDYYEMISTVKRPDKKGDCQKKKLLAKLDKKPSPPKGSKGTAEASHFNDAVISALKQFNKSASSEFTEVSSKKDDLTRFTLRISRDDCLLPNTDLINEAINNNCVKPRSLEGANRLIFGAVQQASGKTRVTTRVVEIETGIIIQTGKGDANGTDRKALENATSRAFNEMGFKPSCAKPMENDLSDEAPRVQ